MRIAAIILFVVPLLSPLSAAASGGSSGASSGAPAVPAQSPEQLAIEYFNSGLKYRDKAWELEKRAEDSDKADKLLAKAENQWNKAVNAFRESIDNNPLLHQAHSSLGYAYRKLGRYEESLGAYDRSLELAPGYVEAIEYRAEAYLGLNRLEEVKQAYLDLFRVDRDEAGTLMTAMQSWIEEQQGGGGEVSEQVIEEFSTWVRERSEIASQTAMLTESQGRSW